MEMMTKAISLAEIEDPPFDVRGTLFFLEGHYLFRYRADGGIHTKFVTPKDLAAAFSKSELDTGWMPAGIVRAGDCAKGPYYVYTAPAQKVKVVLDLKDGEAVTIPIPRTVLMGIGSAFYLWAMKNEHFEADSGAFQAPFPNVYLGGKICWGANSPGQAEVKQARQTWELFFASPFNQDLSGNKSLEQRQDVRVMLRKLVDKNKYPLGDLMDYNATIGYMVEEILRKRN